MALTLEKLLSTCELPQFYPKFVASGLKTIEDVKRKPSLVKALLPRTKDYNSFNSTLKASEKAPSATYQQQSAAAPSAAAAAAATDNYGPPDPVMEELQTSAESLRKELRVASSRRANNMIDASSATSIKDARQARLSTLHSTEKVGGKKLLLSTATSGLKAHRRFLELCRQKQTQMNRGGDPIAMNALEEEISTLRNFVQDCLVLLSEARANGTVPLGDTHDAKAAAEAKRKSDTDVEALRELLKDKEIEMMKLNEHLDAEFCSMQKESIRFADEKEQMEREIAKLQAENKQLRKDKHEDDIKTTSLRLETSYLRSALDTLLSGRVDFLKDSNDHSLAQCGLLRQRELEKMEANDSFEKNLQEVENHKAQLKREIDEKKLSAEENIKKMTQLADEHASALQKMRNSYKDAVVRHDTDLSGLKAEHKDQIEGLGKDLDTVTTEKTLLELKLNSKEQEFDEQSIELQHTRDALDELKQQHDQFVKSLEKDLAPAAVQTLTSEEAAEMCRPLWLRRIQEQDPNDGSNDLPLIGYFAELAQILIEKDFDPEYAKRHARRLSFVENTAAMAAAELPVVSGERAFADEIAETIRSQVNSILDRHLKKLEMEIEEGGGLTTPSRPDVSSGPPLIDAIFISSWRVLEKIVGHRMPKNEDEEQVIPDEELPVSLEDEVKANFYEIMRVARALKSEQFCSTPSRNFGGEGEQEDAPLDRRGSPDHSRPGSPSNGDDEYGRKTPIQIRGRRRQ